MINDTSQIVQSQNTVGVNASADSHGYTNILPQDTNEIPVKLVSAIHPAIEQLYAEGYEEGERVTGRNICPVKGVSSQTDWCGILGEYNLDIRVYDYKTEDYTGEHYPDGLSWLAEENYLKGIYYNINGGRNNASVKRFYTIAWESDSGTHAQQAALNDKFPLRPTTELLTRRSTHSKLAVNKDECDDLKQWKEGQQVASYSFASDPAIKDLPRLMRLAGFDHVKESSFQLPGELDFDSVPCVLKTCEPDNVYSLDEIRAAFTEFQQILGIKPYSDGRFAGYQYINQKLNQKKSGVDYRHPKFDPNAFRICEESEVGELLARCKVFSRLCEQRHKGIACPDPETAWTSSLKKVRERVKKEFNIKLNKVNSDVLSETIPEYFARMYGDGFTEAGQPGARNQWHTCQCPSHGSSSGSYDNCHINFSDPGYLPGSVKCQSGCSFADVMTAFRQRAKDVNDKLWNATTDDSQWQRQNETKKGFGNKADELERLEISHEELTGINVTKCRELGIKVSYLNTALLSGKDLNVEPNKITFVVSPKGSGKTKATREITPLYSTIYAWSHRISLARAMAKVLGLDYHEDSDSFSQKSTFCAPSAAEFHPKYLKRKGLHLVDEIDQVINFMFSGLCNKSNPRPIIIKAFEAHLESALLTGSAIYMSADVYQRHLELIYSISRKFPSNPAIEVIINEYKPKLGVLKFDTSDDPTGLIKVLVQKLRDGIPCFVIDDFKDGKFGGKSLAELVLQKIPELADKIKIINSETSKIEADYIANINEASMNTMLLICSPSITSGVSLENLRFIDGVFGFFNGILHGSEASQALGRVRGANEVNVWAAETGIAFEDSREFTPEKVNDFYQRRIGYRNKLIMSFGTDYDVQSEEWTSVWWKVYCEESALKNIEIKHLRHFIRKKLVADGYDVQDVELDSSEAVEEALTNLWDGMEITEAESVAAATEITELEYDELIKKSRKGDSLSKDEQWSIAKYRLLDLFGEELISEAKHDDKNLSGYAAMYVLSKEKRGELTSNMFNYYRAFHLTSEQAIANDLRPGEKQQAAYGTQFIGDIRSNFPKNYWAEELNLKQFIDPTRKVTVHDLQDIITKIQADAEGFELAFGIKVTDKTRPGTLYRSLMEIHGLGFGDDRQEKRVEGKKVQCWQITKESFEFAEAFSQHQKTKRVAVDTGTSEGFDVHGFEGGDMHPENNIFIRNTGDISPAENTSDDDFGFSEEDLDQLSTLRYRADKFILPQPNATPEAKPTPTTTRVVTQLNLFADLDIAA